MTNTTDDDLLKRLREVSFEKHQEAWARSDGGQDLTIGAMLADEAADRIEELEAKLARVEEALTVGVKPLVWIEDGPAWPNCFHALSVVGRYEIGPYKNGFFSCHVEPEMRDVGLNFRTPDAAKAAAQADYEARIRASLAELKGQGDE